MNRLKAQLRIQGMSQAELARLSGVSYVSINRYATGVARPGRGTARKLSVALNCGLDHFMEDGNGKDTQ